MYRRHSKRSFSFVCKAFAVVLVVFHVAATAAEFAPYDCRVDTPDCCCCPTPEDTDGAMSCCVVPQGSHTKKTSGPNVDADRATMGPVCGTSGLVNCLVQPLSTNCRVSYGNAFAHFTILCPDISLATDAWVPTRPRDPPVGDII